MNNTEFFTLGGYVLLATILILISAYLSNTGRIPAWITNFVIVMLPGGLVIPIGKMMGGTLPETIIVAFLYLIVSIVVVRSRKSSGSTESNQSGKLK